MQNRDAHRVNRNNKNKMWIIRPFCREYPVDIR